MSLNIVTDHKWKPFKFDYEVPKKVLDNQFDYQDRNEVFDGFICYRKTWYHLDTFMRNNSECPIMSKWDGHHGDSYFSGILIKISPCGEAYKIATYYS
jgi:hypothetical protein